MVRLIPGPRLLPQSPEGSAGAGGEGGKGQSCGGSSLPGALCCPLVNAGQSGSGCPFLLLLLLRGVNPRARDAEGLLALLFSALRVNFVVIQAVSSVAFCFSCSQVSWTQCLFREEFCVEEDEKTVVSIHFIRMTGSS